MAASPENLTNRKKAESLEQPIAREEWISEEELFTEGSSDEDDMALRMKRRERRENKKGKSVNTCRENRTALRLAHQRAEDSVPNEQAADGVCSVQEIDDCNLKWRPTHGKLRFNSSLDPDLPVLNDGEETEADADGSSGSGSGCGSGPALSLSEAYSNMHKLDALLRDSDRRLKEAQAETLRAQLSTRAQLRQLRDQVGGHNTMLARNWDAFMQLCPASAEPGPGGHHVGAAGDQDCSVLPRISGADSDADSDDSQSSGCALAITDEEKLKLAALLRDVDQDQDVQDRDAALAGLSGYLLDPEARRSLEHIDGKLQELIPDVPDTRGPGLAKGATRQQRLEDIDRCLQALAASALGDVDPVDEDEVRALLRGARGPRGAPGSEPERGDRGDHGDDDDAVLVDSSLISSLLEEARRELPGFRYRHRKEADDEPQGDGDGNGVQAQSRTLPTPNRAGPSM